MVWCGVVWCGVVMNCKRRLRGVWTEGLSNYEKASAKKQKPISKKKKRRALPLRGIEVRPERDRCHWHRTLERCDDGRKKYVCLANYEWVKTEKATALQRFNSVRRQAVLGGRAMLDTPWSFLRSAPFSRGTPLNTPLSTLVQAF